LTALDESPRFDLAARLAGELLALLADLAAGPAGRHLRRSADADGKPLMVCCEIEDKVVWVPVALVDLIRGVKASAPHRTCPACSGSGCKGCHHAGYLPADAGQLLKTPVPHTLPLGGHVADVWGWVRKLKKGGV
jgi:hypothetical protein